MKKTLLFLSVVLAVFAGAIDAGCEQVVLSHSVATLDDPVYLHVTYDVPTPCDRDSWSITNVGNDISVSINLHPNNDVVCIQVIDTRTITIPLGKRAAGAYTVSVGRNYWGGSEIGTAEFEILDIHDSDSDGVPDGLDQCPDSKPNACTDKHGCESPYDINANGKTGIEEAIHILQTVAGLRHGPYTILRGRVFDAAADCGGMADCEAPISGATVMLSALACGTSAQTVTDLSGHFVFNDIVAGSECEYRLTVRADGYLGWDNTIGFMPGEYMVELGLHPSGYLAIPDWLQQKISEFEAVPPKNPPIEIYRATYKGAIVYYIIPYCCDIMGELYDENGNLICYPDGGISGSGDGQCPDFKAVLGDTGELVWKDMR